MPPSAPPRNPRAVLFLTVFIDLMGFGIVIPLLPIYAERQMSASPLAASCLIAVYSLMQLVFAPLWGRLSDRVGRRPVLLVSLSGSVLSYLMLAGAGSLWMLFLARVLAGVAGANISVAQAYMADVTSGSERAKGMGLIGAAFGLGMVIGPAIGGGLSLVGPRAPELFAAFLCLVNVAMAVRRLPESLPPELRRSVRLDHPLAPSSLRGALAAPGAAALFTISFLVTLGFAVLEGTFSLKADRFAYSPGQVAALWVYMALVAVVVQGRLVGQLAQRVPERALVAAGTVGLAVGLAWIPFASSVLALLAALALVVGGQGLASPSLSSLISKTAGVSIHGAALGLAQSLSAAARVLGPAGGGFLFQRLGSGTPYVAAALCAAGAFAIVVPGLREERRAPGSVVLRRSG